MTKITNYYEHQFSDQAPESLALMLHGVGSNGRDLISLAPYWAKDLPGTRFISPDAPFPCDMVPPGYPDSYQWFSLLERDPDKILAGVLEAASALTAFIDEMLEKFNLSADRLVLVGFSQGTMMSLYAGPHYKDKIAGILGYSGALVWPQDTATENLHKMPVRLIHGEEDDVVPVEAYHLAKKTLEQAGFDVSGHTSPGLAHSIDERGIQSGKDFLQSVLEG